MRVFSGVLCSLAMFFAFQGIATAQQADAATQARTHFQTGQSLVSERRFDEAYREFEAGYALSNRALFLFNMAECARESGRTSQARIDYARYLEADPNGSQAEVARERLAILGPEPVVESGSANPDPEPVTTTVATPEEAAASTLSAPEAALRVSESDTGENQPELWEDWPFWTVIGGVLVAGAIAGTVAGVVVSSTPSCEMGCVNWSM